MCMYMCVCVVYVCVYICACVLISKSYLKAFSVQYCYFPFFLSLRKQSVPLNVYIILSLLFPMREV